MYYLKYLPYREYRRFSTYKQTAIQTGRALVSEKAAGTEKGNKDIMSILGIFTPEMFLVFDRSQVSVPSSVQPFDRCKISAERNRNTFADSVCGSIRFDIQLMIAIF
jgi:hypothetical protein